MKIEEALQFADQWRNKREAPCGDALVILAAEVRRLQSVEAVPSTIKCKDCLDTGEQLGVYGRIKCGCQSKAVEAVPVGYALANLDGTIRNHGDGELMVYRNPFSRSDKTDCIPLYMHPPSLDDNTRKMVLELCESLSSGEILSLDDANTFLRSMYVKAKNIREKLGAGDE